MFACLICTVDLWGMCYFNDYFSDRETEAPKKGLRNISVLLYLVSDRTEILIQERLSRGKIMVIKIE